MATVATVVTTPPNSASVIKEIAPIIAMARKISLNTERRLAALSVACFAT